MKTAICAIIKDEHLYLQEWIEWHLGLGFDAIHLFEDKGSKPHQEITDKYDNVYCEPYDDNKIKIDEPDGRQTTLYKWFSITFKDIYDWVAYIDIDEYINFDSNYSLAELCSEFKGESAVTLSWKMMSSEGFIKRPNNIVGSYINSASRLGQDEGWNYKSIVNLKKYNGMKTMHLANDAVNILGETYSDIILEPVYTKAWINHYFTKSWEDWQYRIFKRGDLVKGHRTAEQFFEINPIFNCIKSELYDEIVECCPLDSFWIDRRNKKIHGGNISIINKLNGIQEEDFHENKTIFIKPVQGARFGNLLFMLAFSDKIESGQFIILDKNANEFSSDIFRYFLNYLGISKIYLYGTFSSVNKDYLINNEDIKKDVTYDSSMDNLILYGYFQENPSEKFVNNIKKHISKHELNEYIVVHVRRGDFLSEHNKQIHPVMSKDFYDYAMNLFDGNNKFLFISDEIKWCKENFKGKNIFYSNNTDIDDFKILLGAKSIIFGNSTFAYWGAILNINPSCKVVCNRNWYTEKSGLNSYCDKLFPKNWTLLNFKY